MANLTEEEKASLGELIEPFARSKKEPEKKILKDGEREFFQEMHDGFKNEKPEHNFVYITAEEVTAHIKTVGRCKEKSFLWVIDDTSVKIIREKTRNTLRTYDDTCVCHTNLTGAGKAYIGGEMFFCEDGNIYINHFSDRYGNPSDQQWEAAKAYVKKVGYSQLVDILELLKDG